jgi:hypothetical protein
MHKITCARVLVFYYIILLVCYCSMFFSLSGLCPYVTLCLVSICRSLHYPHIGFADGARSTQNLASTAWEIYAPTNELITLRGVCLGRVTNNMAEYSTVIEFLIDVILFGIRRLVVKLDSHLVVLHLSNVYAIRSPTLLRVYLQIRLLERYFDYIEY